MKDFDGAYAMLNDSRKMNVKLVAGMYNTIMAGYFREKKISDGLRVLKQMELDSVKPDPQTYSYLIAHCDCEEDIIKYYEELKCSGITVTKHIFMSLISAYAACGQFEKAKQALGFERTQALGFERTQATWVSIKPKLWVRSKPRQPGFKMPSPPFFPKPIRAFFIIINQPNPQKKKKKRIFLLGSFETQSRTQALGFERTQSLAWVSIKPKLWVQDA
ncbi:hypothetical protein SLEP1_g49478 [Rubroshorea leprosula]|uniref:Pentatricopeptide repeat-containing protein n=1 Tax=Rubroshorea leprosula TaxID=152421 RepID=A0AAV5LWX3_9ROSI|nr:hypothetical protein SLEP1_g49478 [Rubroshorea leprosula]